MLKPSPNLLIVSDFPNIRTNFHPENPQLSFLAAHKRLYCSVLQECLDYFAKFCKIALCCALNNNYFKAIQLTLEMLRHRVGSPLSFASLARDIHCSPNTIKRYVEIFEALFIIFRVTPYHRNIARSLLKEPKIYFYDTGMIKGDEGIRFENLIACSLLKHLNAIEDYQGRRAELKYLRTKEKKEVDFALVVEDRPLTLVETKLADATVSPTLKYFNRKYGFPAVQVINNLRQERISDSVELRKGVNFLKTLKL